MKLLANENFPLKSYLYLREKGYDIISIGLETPGILDSEVMNLAIEENRTIITFGRDYGELIFKNNYKPLNGVIYLRLKEYRSDEPGKIIEDLIINDIADFSRALTVVDRNGIRQRKY